MNFLGMGPMELMLILVLALIIFGPGKLPEIAGQVGRVVRDFRRTTAELSSEFNRTLSLEIEEKKAAQTQQDVAPAPPVPAEAYAAAPLVTSEAAPAPVAVEPSEAPPVVAPEPAVVASAPASAPATGEVGAATAPANESATLADSGGATKRRNYDADLAPPY